MFLNDRNRITYNELCRIGENRIAEAIEKYHAKLLVLDLMSSYIGEGCSMNNANERVRMEAPEIFRVIGKRKPELAMSYLTKLEYVATHDTNKVVRIHIANLE